jgi:glycosyltransferase involved in cell wall biosynthesis
MNIGIDAKRIFFNNSGLGNYGRRFYQALAKNLTDNTFHLYTPRQVNPGNPYLSEINFNNSRVVAPVKRSHQLFSGSLWRSRLIKDQLHRDKIEAYYGLSNEIPFGLDRLSLKKIVVIHDLIFLRYPQLYPAVDSVFYKIKTRYACEHSSRIIAVSEQTKKDIMDFYNIPSEKISVLYPASDPIFYNGEIVDSGGFFKPNRDYMISIGAITPRKNLLKTVQALHIIKDKFDLDLVVIGTAVGLGRKYLDTIQTFIRKNDLQGRVHFLGNVPYKFVPDLCRKAKMMIYPSQFEGFGMPIIEGLFSEIPVLTSQGGCFPEAGGDAAIYLNGNDHKEIAFWVEKVLESNELRKEMIIKGLKHAERFKQNRIEDDILKFHLSI